MRQSESVKVRVRVPVTHDVYYMVEVEDPSDVDEVSRALSRKDPGSPIPVSMSILDVWKHVVDQLQKEDIEIL